LFIALSTSLFAQKTRIFSQELFQNIQHSNNVNIYELRNQKNTKLSKHIERYIWREHNSVDSKGNITPDNIKIKSFLEANSKIDNSKSLANWAPIGLTSWVCGNSGYNPGNGRINAVSVDPNNSQIIYACAASGGLWKTNDGGATWNTSTDQLAVLGTSDIAIDPNNTSVLYLGTGDRDGLHTYGVGVYKSTDQGSTWTPSGLFNNYASKALIVNALEIDPQRTNVIYAATNSGIYKSTNAGTNWTKVLSGSNYMEIKVNPLDSNTVFAISKTRFYRSQDGGNSFQMITSGIPSGNTIRLAMDIYPDDTAKVYILYASQTISNSKILVSTDGGTTFKERFKFNSKNLLGYASDGSDQHQQAYYDLTIAVSKTDSNDVYMGGINVWHSTDGGVSWNISSKWVYNTTGEYTHADIHSLDFYGGTLYCGSDGGVAKKTNNAGWVNLSSGLNISQIYNFSNSADGKKMAIACQDNGINIKSNGQWTHVMGADGIDVKISPIDSNNVFYSIQFGVVYNSSTGGDDGGLVFNPDDHFEYPGFVSPMSIYGSNNTTNIYLGLADVYTSSDNGQHWRNLSFFNGVLNSEDIEVAPSDSNYIYIDKANDVKYTHNAGLTWKTSTGLGSGFVTDITVSRTNPLDVYVLKSSSNSKVYHSTDGGQTFTLLPTTLNISANMILTEGGSLNGLYIATDFGVYYINDYLSSWVNYSDQLPYVKVTDMQIVNNKLRAATFGRGVWEADLYKTTSINSSQRIDNLVSISPNPTNDIFRINYKNIEIKDIMLFNVSGALVRSFDANQNSFSIGSLVNGVYFVRIDTNKGVIIKRIVKI
ncbi:MAG: hypothetical protein DSY76_00815, partial [Bacteroidetes bacterium]